MYVAELDYFFHIQLSATHDQHAVKGGPSQIVGMASSWQPYLT
jgi:hypothetical protein